MGQRVDELPDGALEDAQRVRDFEALFVEVDH